MKIKVIKKEIEGVFLQPKKTYYFGKLVHGTPYFWPMGYCPTIIKIRKLEKRTPDEIEAHVNGNSWLIGKEDTIYKHIPMVRRSYNKILKVFGKVYYIEWGWPVAIHKGELGWKDKFESPRFEWGPAFIIFFFKLQFGVFWGPPSNDKWGPDIYWEMILWYLHYSDKDIKKAKETWGWVDGETKESTWDDNYLIEPTTKDIFRTSCLTNKIQNNE